MNGSVASWVRAVLVAALLSGSNVPVYAEESYSPRSATRDPQNVYWGDTHLHTSLSVDAVGLGNASLGPDDAYRFAMGEVVRASNGMKARLNRPLDFLVIADHDVNMGVLTAIDAGDRGVLRTGVAKRWRAVEAEERRKGTFDPNNRQVVWDTWAATPPQVVGDSEIRRSVWQEVTAAADRYNTPGKFTAFIAYEWTPSRLSGTTYRSWHRNVIFKGNASKANRILPFSAAESANPEDLWRFLQRYEDEVDDEVLAIPHNANNTRGGMFALDTMTGAALTKDYALTRSRWEPLYEVTQMKGDTETHPFISPTDEFADFERFHTIFGRQIAISWDDAERRRKESEYARSALKLGLKEQARLGANPFKFGMAGGTDSHTSLSTAEEDNFWGNYAGNEPRPNRLFDPVGSEGAFPKVWELGAAGMTAVWSTENSRDALFAAMKRRETYATTGPRMTVRFFGGWSFDAQDAVAPDLAQRGYRKGVPMGADLTRGPAGAAPTFLIRAVRDPEGANLDRVQVVKGWLDAGGQLHEKIYDVALSGGRVAGRNGKVPPVGNSVDVATATYTNTLGAPELAVVWTDPQFKADEASFYYLRVLEIPTPRWTAYEARRFNLKVEDKAIPMVLQERAYTSPIWYTPSGIGR